MSVTFTNRLRHPLINKIKVLLNLSDCCSSVLSLHPPLIFSLFSQFFFLFAFPFVSLRTLPLCSYHFPNSHFLTSISSHSTHCIPSIVAFIAIVSPLTSLSLSPFIFFLASFLFFLMSSRPHYFLLSCSDRGKQSPHSQYSHAHLLSITSFRWTQSQYTINRPITNKHNEYQLIFCFRLYCMFYN